MDTDSDPERTPSTRLLFLGDQRLADGFRLIGFEVWPDPSPHQVEQVMRALVQGRQRAFVIVDDALMAQQIPHLQRVRREGGRIVVIAVPALDATPPQLSSDVARRLTALFGNVIQHSEESS